MLLVVIFNPQKIHPTIGSIKILSILNATYRLLELGLKPTSGQSYPDRICTNLVFLGLG